MASAEVGDDVYGEDPTVNRLEALAAEKMGKEAGLFVASGTMGNLVAVLAHCRRGDEAIMGHLGHTYLLEGGGVSALGGVHPHTVLNQPDGTLALADIENAICPDNVHFPISRLVILENTHNRCGGVPLSKDYTDQTGELAHRYGMNLHLDGARIFNAAVATGIKADLLAEAADSVTFCLSKGLCAPVGSVLCGSMDFIQTARRIRKQVGGGMRQAGILAAAGILALDSMVERLSEDHRRARELANRLANVKSLRLDSPVPPTNMVFASLDNWVKFSAGEIAARLKSMDILVSPISERRFRLVTHYWIGDEDVTAVASAFGRILDDIIV
jgi:threonine aldolase